MSCHGETAWYVKRPLEPLDLIEAAARQHFLGLHRKVFAPCLGSPLQLCTGAPWAAHGAVLTELFAAEDEQSVVFGLLYALLSLQWDRKLSPGRSHS